MDLKNLKDDMESQELRTSTPTKLKNPLFWE